MAALIVAAGKGERAGGGLPKQFALLGGKPVLAHSVDVFAAHPAIASIHVVVAESQFAAARAALKGRTVSLVSGGKERQDSVAQGLASVAGSGADAVLIHDAARPGLPAAVIDRLIAALAHSEAVIPALTVADTVARADTVLGETIDRASIVRVQTPQGFRMEAILRAHRDWPGTPASDDAQMARNAGYDVAVIEGDALLDKITRPEDLVLAEARLMAGKTSRSGMGFDVHRLEAGRELWLGGVFVPHTHGLAGHSDADVALHAVVDALLGAAGDGDIGSHFPPSDAQWKGASSSRFVEHARDRIAARGGVIDHVDLTVICEAPKIGPHREAIRKTIAALLQVDMARVSVKATTTERLGFTGRGEGIAAQAVATIRI